MDYIPQSWKMEKSNLKQRACWIVLLWVYDEHYNLIIRVFAAYFNIKIPLKFKLPRASRI